MQKWHSLGLIIRPEDIPWAHSHAQLPVPHKIKDNIFRIYFASRDENQYSSVGWADVAIHKNGAELLAVSEQPVLTPGSIGEFDEHGVYPASMEHHNGEDYLYTIGWNKGAEAPLFYAHIGLALGEGKNGRFKKLQNYPIMGRGEHDPCLVTSPVVRKIDELWYCWYVSGYKWERLSTGLQSHYNVKLATSRDGINWQRDGTVCIQSATQTEFNISRFWVERFNGSFHGWFSSKEQGKQYWINYASSPDGIHWHRQGEIELSGVRDEWDSEASAYPAVIEHNNDLFMLYNGNGFGKSGIGLAILQS